MNPLQARNQSDSAYKESIIRLSAKIGKKYYQLLPRIHCFKSVFIEEEEREDPLMLTETRSGVDSYLFAKDAHPFSGRIIVTHSVCILDFVAEFVFVHHEKIKILDCGR